MNRKNAWLVLALVALVLGATSIPAAGFDQSSKPIVLSFEKTLSEYAYDPIVAPSGGLTTSVTGCKTRPTCDTIPLELNVPKDELYRFSVTVSFEHGAEGENDIDVYFWEECFECEVHEDGTKTTTFTQFGSAASAGEPEIAKFADMPPTSFPPIRYWMTVVNFSGVALAYRVKAVLVPGGFVPGDYESGTTIRPRQFAGPGSKATSAKPNAGGSLPLAPDVPTAEFEKVKVPGPDGELTELPLVAIKGQATAQKAPDRRPLIIIAIGILILGAATFVFFKLRGRASGETTT